jgi:hypothetical protein
MSARWEPSFAAVAALLGEPAEAIEAALGPGRAHARELLRALRATDRAAKARAIAGVVTEIATALESMRRA